MKWNEHLKSVIVNHRNLDGRFVRIAIRFVWIAVGYVRMAIRFVRIGVGYVRMGPRFVRMACICAYSTPFRAKHPANAKI